MFISLDFKQMLWLLLLLIVSSVSGTTHTTLMVVNSSSANCSNGSSLQPGIFCQLYKALNYSTSNTRILISYGTYKINNEAVFNGLTKLSMIGVCSDNEDCSRIVCDDKAGLKFNNSAQVVLENLVLIGCGIQYDTIDYSHQPVLAALIFEHCSSVNLTRMSFIGSRGTALGLTNNYDLINITDCTFSDSNSSNSYGGGVQINFSPNIKVNVVLQNCRFLNNSADSGGGLSVNITDGLIERSLLIQDCYFEDNQAKFKGGGMFVKLSGTDSNVENVLIKVQNTIFKGNQCIKQLNPSLWNHCYGGAVALYVFNAGFTGSSTNNSIKFSQRCIFTNNEAINGAGISVTTARQKLTSTSLTLTDSQFHKNKGVVGFAVHVHAEYNKQVTGSLIYLNVTITNCTFTMNSILETTCTGQGVVYIADVPVYFKGTLDFHQNNGTALTLVSTQVWLMNDTTVIFTENRGHLGGAISLLSRAMVRFYNGVHIEFINNHAELKGGAVYVSDLYYDIAICPFYHVIDGSNYTTWNVNVSMYNNTINADNKINSIFMPSVLTCQKENRKVPAFCWGNWYYGTNNCSEEIQTAPSQISLTRNKISAFPGQFLSLPLRLTDDYNNDVTNYSTITVSVANKLLQLVLGSRSFPIHGNSTQKLTVITAEPRVIKKHITVQIVDCPPGYQYELAKQKCTCTKAFSDTQDILSCGNNYQAKMYWTWCMTKESNTSNTVSTVCWPDSKAIDVDKLKKVFDLPNKIDQLDEQFCRPIKRTGTLCSHCIDGYGFPVLTYNINCVKCNSTDQYKDVLKYIAAQYIPLTVFLLILLFFKVSINNGYMNAFVFYAQSIANYSVVARAHSLLHSKQIHILFSVIMFPYSIWNLDFIQPISALGPFCFGVTVRPLHILALSYITALYPLVIIAIFLVIIHFYEKGNRFISLLWRPFGRCFARFHQKMKFQNTIVDVFSTFIILSYNKITAISFQILAFSIVHSSNEPKKYAVVEADKSIGYCDTDHLPFFLIAVFFLVTVVALPPILLVLYPLTVFQRCLDKLKLRGGLIEALFHSFTGCYKDGANGEIDRRCFATFYFILRIASLSLITIPMNIIILQIITEASLFSGALLLILIVKPYRQTSINYLDAFILTLIVVMFISSYFVSWTKSQLYPTKLIYAIISSLPLFYLIILVIYKVYRICPCRLPKLQWRKSQNNTPCSHRLLCPAEY